MDNQIYMDIQKLIYYMIPEKWKYIKLYMSIIENPERGKRGELFFYYMPKRFFRNTYINCYEVPKLFDVDQDEYLNLISKLYNNIIILNKKCKKEGNYWTNVTIVIEGSICKFEYYNEDLLNSNFDSYERHIIWRKKYLRIEPETKEEKEILSRYYRSKEVRIKPSVYVVSALKNKVKNIVEYEKVLSIDEALARGTEDTKEYIGKAIPPSSINKKNVKILEDDYYGNEYENDYDYEDEDEKENSKHKKGLIKNIRKNISKNNIIGKNNRRVSSNNGLKKNKNRKNNVNIFIDNTKYPEKNKRNHKKNNMVKTKYSGNILVDDNINNFDNFYNFQNQISTDNLFDASSYNVSSINNSSNNNYSNINNNNDNNRNEFNVDNTIDDDSIDIYYDIDSIDNYDIIVNNSFNNYSNNINNNDKNDNYSNNNSNNNSNNYYNYNS